MIDLFEILLRTDGVLGARFSGAGFRGCCAALVEPGALPHVQVQVQRAYAAQHPDLAAHAPCLACQTGDGAELL